MWLRIALAHLVIGWLCCCQINNLEAADRSSETREAPVDFDTDIMPLFTKAGCNSGACHGAAIGRGDFRLSLFGANPQSDYDQIVRFRRGRRINRIDASQSLILLKPTESISHEGGTRFEVDSDIFQLIEAWIEQGAVRQNTRALTGIEIQPGAVIAAKLGDTQEVRVIAKYSDGSRRDVTQMSVIESLDPQSVEGKGHRLVCHRAGRHGVLIRYASQVQLAMINVPFQHQQSSASAKRDRFHAIDDEINRSLDQMGLPVVEQASPAILARRLSLDLTGRLPTPEQLQQLNSLTEEAYEKFVDQLLNSPAFSEYWTYHWANVMRVGAGRMPSEAAKSYYEWIAHGLRDDRSLAELARATILAEGPLSAGATGFYRVTDDARLQAELASEVWLGVRLRCANCHDHPLDRWTQDDYHGLSAIFAQVDHGPNIRRKSSGFVPHPRTGQAAMAKLPGDRFLNDGDPLEQLADWLTRPENPYFARNIVNRVWQTLMGRGFYEPIDDQRSTNMVSHPELLDWLTHEFVRDGHRLKGLVKTIVMSAAYRRAARPLEATQTGFFATAMERPLPAPVLLDAIEDVLELSHGSSSHIALISPDKNEELQSLGICDRATTCGGGEGKPDESLAKTLQWLNGKIVNGRLSDDSNWLNRAIERKETDEQLIDQLYLRALARAPSPAERYRWISLGRAVVTGATLDETKKARRELWQDIAWSLFTSQEFRTNH